MSWRTVPALAGRHVTLRPIMAAARNALVVTDAADDQCEIFCTNVAPKKEPGGSIAWAMTGQESGRRLAFLLERTP